MKRAFCLLIALFTFVLCFPVWADTDVERLNVSFYLSDAQTEALTKRLNSLTKELKVGLAVCDTMATDIFSSSFADPEISYAQWVTEKENYGYGKKDSAVVLFLEDRNTFRLYVQGYGETAFSSEYIEYAEECLRINYVETDDKYETIVLYLDLCEDIISAKRAGEEYDISVAPRFDRIHDNAGLLTEDEYNDIKDRLDRYSTELDFDIVIYTTPNYVSESYALSAAQNCFEQYEYGMGESSKDGILLYIAIGSGLEGERRWATYVTNNFSGTVFDDTTLYQIEDEFLTYLKQSDYYSAFKTFADRSYETIKNTDIMRYQGDDYYNEINDEYRRKDDSILYLEWLPIDGIWIPISIAAGMLLSFATLGLMRYKMRSVRFQPHANTYLKNGSFNLTDSSDTFLYKNVSRIRKSSSSSGGSGGSGGGGSRSSGGGGGHSGSF